MPMQNSSEISKKNDFFSIFFPFHRKNSPFSRSETRPFSPPASVPDIIFILLIYSVIRDLSIRSRLLPRRGLAPRLRTEVYLPDRFPGRNDRIRIHGNYIDQIRADIFFLTGRCINDQRMSVRQGIPEQIREISAAIPAGTVRREMTGRSVSVSHFAVEHVGGKIDQQLTV